MNVQNKSITLWRRCPQECFKSIGEHCEALKWKAFKCLNWVQYRMLVLEWSYCVFVCLPMHNPPDGWLTGRPPSGQCKIFKSWWMYRCEKQWSNQHRATVTGTMMPHSLTHLSPSQCIERVPNTGRKYRWQILAVRFSFFFFIQFSFHFLFTTNIPFMHNNRANTLVDGIGFVVSMSIYVCVSVCWPNVMHNSAIYSLRV